MNFKIMTFAFLALATTSIMAKDIVNENMVGIRSSNGEKCVIQHRQLDYSSPELFVSLYPADGEEFKIADAGLLEVFNLDLKTYNNILYGKSTVSLFASKGNIYNYSIKAQSSGVDRIVTINGKSTDGNRISNGIITVRKGLVQSVKLEKQAKTFLFGFKTVFSDTCGSVSKL